MSAPSKFSAMLKGTCPHCRQGKMFTHPVTNLAHFRDMHELCPVCGLKFEREPGFFWGAMYVSYALTTALSIISGVFLYYVFNDPDLWVYTTVIITLTIGISPVTFRAARVLMMYFLSGVKYDPRVLQKS